MADVTVILPSIWVERASLLSRALLSVQQQALQVEARVVIGRDKADARNLGLVSVDTEWTAFLDDDDEMLPDHIEILAGAAARSGADLIWAPALVRHDASGRERVFDYDATADMLLENNYIPTGYLVRTALALGVGGFPPMLPGIPEDWGFIRRLVRAGAKLHYVGGEPTWIIHLHGGNTFNNEGLLKGM